jgi:phosphatidylglycerophosphatase A
MSILAQRIVTLAKIGYLPASGTLATLITIPFVCLITLLKLNYLWCLSFCIVASFLILHSSLPWFERHDPREVVIDEVIGCLITFYGVTCSFKTMVLGFVIFRLLDIFKPFFIGWCERMPGVWGIMLDDICAGICANILLRYFL